MGSLIPRDLARAPGISANDIRVGIALQRTLPDDAWIWYNSPQHSTRPRFVLLAADLGVIGIEVCDWSPIDVESAGSDGVRISGGPIADPVADLGRKLEALRTQARSPQIEPPISGLLILPNFREAELSHSGLTDYLKPGTIVTKDRLNRAGLEKVVHRRLRPLEASALREIRARLYPETQFDVTRLSYDADRVRRETIRLQLDAEQETIARSLSDGITIISGVAGSGKTLVLCARARVLAAEHPDWRIQMLCYNRTLVQYLRKLVGEAVRPVEIDTFYSWAGRLGLRLPPLQFGGDDHAIDKIIERALARGTGVGTCDAVLLDEGQDFAPGWLRLAYQTLEPGRGGMVVASDMAQAIYREDLLSEVFPLEKTTHILLSKNYRNTSQIGRFALSAVFGENNSGSGVGGAAWDGRKPPAPDFALDGPSVQLVWAERWDAQADFLSQEIRRLVGQRRAAYRDIAVLYTQRMGTVRRILQALEQLEIPHFWVNRNNDSKTAVDFADNSVKVVTVHSSKGMEFPIVFLFGVEALRVPDTLSGASTEEANLTRVAYVGMTRAQDILYLTYTRSNPIIEKALRLSKWAEFHSFPEDFDFE